MQKDLQTDNQHKKNTMFVILPGLKTFVRSTEIAAQSTICKSRPLQGSLMLFCLLQR